MRKRPAADATEFLLSYRLDYASAPRMVRVRGRKYVEISARSLRQFGFFVHVHRLTTEKTS